MQPWENHRTVAKNRLKINAKVYVGDFSHFFVSPQLRQVEHYCYNLFFKKHKVFNLPPYHYIRTINRI